jgi:hypothetical protein
MDAIVFYTWGGFSLLHGAGYLIPLLDIAREADRFIYLTQFGMALLAGYGLHALSESRGSAHTAIEPLQRILKWLVVLFGFGLAAASLGFPLAVSDWTYLSFFFIAAAYVLLLVVHRWI